MAKKLNGADWGERFLELLASGLGPEAASSAVGIVKATAYKRRNRDAEFRRRWDDARRQGRGEARRPVDVATDALSQIATDPEATPTIRLAAARELRVHGRFADRGGEEPRDGDGPKSDQPEPPVDDAVQALLRAAEVRSTVQWLNYFMVAIGLNGRVGILKVCFESWQEFAGRPTEFQRDVLEAARNPKPLVAADGAVGEGPEAARPHVIRAIERLIAGDALDAVWTELAAAELAGVEVEAAEGEPEDGAGEEPAID